MIAAASPLAALGGESDLVGALVLACGDLAHGFAAPPGSRRRIEAHHRAWVTVRQIDRELAVTRQRRRATPEIVAKAQRAIDRADVMIAALPGVLPM